MKKLTPEEEARIVAMREAGFTYPVIAERTGRSLASVKRVCVRFKASRGAIGEAIIAEARRELRAEVSQDEAIQATAAAILIDTRLHCERLREKLHEAADKLAIDSPEDARQAFRALNSYANSIKLTADAMRSAAKIDTTDSLVEEDLEVLPLRVMTQDDCRALRDQQRAEDALLRGEGSEEEGEIVELH